MYKPHDPQKPDTSETTRIQTGPDEGLLVNGLKQVKRLVIAVIGGTVLAVGVLMLVMPGPGLIVIPVGLGILAIEFAWARRLLRRFKEKGASLRDSFGATKSNDPEGDRVNGSTSGPKDSHLRGHDEK